MEINLVQRSLKFYSLAFFGIILIRYFLVAGSTYLFFYSSLSESFANPYLESPAPSRKLIYQDIKLSILSSIIFAIVAALIMSSYDSGLTCLYSDFQGHQLWYFIISYIGVLILQDSYFYFTHRLFHHPFLFHKLHRGHHQSRYPTPWTSFAFDPLEAVVQSLFFVVIVYVIPLHFITLIAVLITMTIWAVVNHLGLDRLPLSFPHHWLGKWFIGPAHHSLHHLKYQINYGLYFTFWDKVLGTQDPNYESQIRE
ncbi:sterol desaturase family protein [Cyanothece sp. BG0011]|uniref:sterol desaturase family protein n=1 Tax=Cyanothece sp. BG0011 TaxID=2082950 RepID=UPI000D1D6D5D|nr:sterol desaturase family protein [Cyanothece sp. BG0011]